MAKLKLTETRHEQTVRQAKDALAGAVRAANGAVHQLKQQIHARGTPGGRAKWLADLGDDSQDIIDGALACKAFVEAMSDLPTEELPAEE